MSSHITAYYHLQGQDKKIFYIETIYLILVVYLASLFLVMCCLTSIKKPKYIHNRRIIPLCVVLLLQNIGAYVILSGFNLKLNMDVAHNWQLTNSLVHDR